MNTINEFIDWLQEQKHSKSDYTALANFLEDEQLLSDELRQTDSFETLTEQLETAIITKMGAGIGATGTIHYLHQAIATFQNRAERGAQANFAKGFWRHIAKNFNQYVVSGLVLLVFGILFFAIFSDDADLINQIAKDDVARGLITFIFSIGTISVAIILTLFVILGENTDETQKRFQSAKEVFTILIGIFGTIVGFYFGSADSAVNGQDSQQPPTVQESSTEQPFERQVQGE